MLRVAVQERRRLYREGLALLLEAEADLEVVSTVATGPELLDVCVDGGVDVVVLEAESSQWETTMVARSLRELLPGVRLVGLVCDLVTAARTVGGPTDAVVAHEEGFGPVLDAVRRSTVAPVRRLTPRAAESSRSVLTGRELEVLSLISCGSTTREIALRLSISPKTVENHKQRMFAKLDVQNQAHAVAIAMRSGMLPTGGVAEPVAVAL